jgi:Tfp pilus assembly protein PilP
MIAARILIIGAALVVSAPIAAQAPQTPPPAPQTAPSAPPLSLPLSTLKIGTRVGLPERTTYDDGGRRDPFVSLIVEKAPAVSTASGSMEARAKGLAGVSVVDAAVKGIITSGDKWIAIIAGPNGAQYLAHADDRLHDGSIRRIDRESVLFVARVADGTGKMVSREVRKGIRATAGDAK